MKEKLAPFKGIYQTGATMREFIEAYHEDVSFLDELSVEECFYKVAHLPYIEDPKDAEAVQRPMATFSPSATFRDCDDKMVALGACLKRRGYKFDIVAVSEDPKSDVHHVVLYADLGKAGKHFLDPTYPHNIFLEHNPFYEVVRIG